MNDVVTHFNAGEIDKAREQQMKDVGAYRLSIDHYLGSPGNSFCVLSWT